MHVWDFSFFAQKKLEMQETQNCNVVSNLICIRPVSYVELFDVDEVHVPIFGDSGASPLTSTVLVLLH